MSRIEKEFLAEECGIDESEVYNSYPIDKDFKMKNNKTYRKNFFGVLRFNLFCLRAYTRTNRKILKKDILCSICYSLDKAYRENFLTYNRFEILISLVRDICNNKKVNLK